MNTHIHEFFQGADCGGEEKPPHAVTWGGPQVISTDG